MADATFHNAGLEGITARLNHRLTTYFPEFCADPVSVKLASVAHRSYSSLYFFDVVQANSDSNRCKGLAVKLFSPESGGCEAARSQYAALTSTWPAFQKSPNLSIPRPLDFFPELSAVVTEKVDGEPLQRLFKKIPAQTSQLILLNDHAGQWLQRFHRTTALPPDRLDVDNKLQHLEANLDHLRRLGFAEGLCQQLKDSVSSLAQRLGNVDLAMAGVHGDFTVDNLLVDGDKIIAIDLGGRDRNAVYHDMATYINSLMLIRLSWPAGRSLLERARDAFLAGYFAGEHHNHSAVSFLRLIGLVSIALEILGRRRDQWLAAWWVRRFFERAFRRLLDEADG